MLQAVQLIVVMLQNKQFISHLSQVLFILFYINKPVVHILTQLFKYKKKEVTQLKQVIESLHVSHGETHIWHIRLIESL